MSARSERPPDWLWRRRNAIFDYPDLSKNQMLVLLALEQYADDEGECFPSIPTLARRTRLHRATVLRLLTRLEQLGLVAIERARGRTHYNHYALNLPQLQAAAQQNVAPCDVSGVPAGGENVANGAENVANRVVKGRAVRPERTNGLSKELSTSSRAPLASLSLDDGAAGEPASSSAVEVPEVDVDVDEPEAEEAAGAVILSHPMRLAEAARFEDLRRAAQARAAAYTERRQAVNGTAGGTPLMETESRVDRADEREGA